ncbi:class F sortase [Streptoalloteichus tenebrarius]|uniref:class F sortase n=1 Tax=Streptoalloteichus tenebrarius (strain ATCC 17920 / DSM 40477 / JCM 4838 / CBS 697.72 / NBRC 16177 / NCIMB 11028 / NRRL B-12390 / A12253. 1 / ISP 5477) TaxID=1933 RepID=UPI0020A40291|nr:class F sortase [Streptoalloteichus tenebrarius]
MGVVLAVLGAALLLASPSARPEDVGELPPPFVTTPRPTHAPASRPMVGPLLPSGVAPSPGPSRSVAPPSPPAPPPRLAPLALAMPSVGVTAEVEPARVNQDGSLAVPRDAGKVGWWTGGAVPESPSGTMVIAGHVDDVRTGAGAFFRLRDLRLGAPVEVATEAGSYRYRVIARRTRPKWALPQNLFDPRAPHRLVLITCAGPFDESRGGYPDNLMVFADPVSFAPWD